MDKRNKSADWQGRWTVSIFTRYETYGGPEEGGWSYTHYRLKMTIAVFQTEDDARLFARAKLDHEDLARMNDEYKEQVYHGWATQCGGDETVNSMRPEGYIPTGLTMHREDTLQVSPEGEEKTYEYTSPDPSEGYC